jgi:nucleotide-binding universal stress UspA family protein
MENTGTTATPLVVVGTDGSEHGDRAVSRAAAEAARMGVPLRVVHVVRVAESLPGFEPLIPGDDIRDEAARLTQAAVTAARERYPELTVEGEVEFGSPGDVLEAAARDATLLVTGSRGHGGFTGLLLGSVSRSLAAHSTCPLLIVRGEGGAPTATGEPRLAGTDVLLGVQNDEDAAALVAAFEAALRWGLPVRAVHAWTWPGYLGLAGPTDEDMRAVTEVHETFLADALAPVRAEYPDVEVRAESILADAAGALIDASRTSALVVVGVRRHRGPLRHWVGHVATAASEHAHCPVLIVPVD